jgi:biotin transport system ATP-binding protein
MLIEFHNVSVFRGKRQVLFDVNVSLSERRIGVIGPNGAGKSTFARLINGLVLPQDGTVTVSHKIVSQNLDDIRQEVGFLFQNPDNQIVFPVVQEDMAFGLKPRLPEAARRNQRIIEVLDQLGIGSLVDRAVQTLSGGEKQLVALACVLCTRPSLLVLDEPTTQLDLRYRNRLLRILRELSQPAIVLTHDLQVLSDFDRVLVIDGGKIVKDGSPAAVVPWYEEHFQ